MKKKSDFGVGLLVAIGSLIIINYALATTQKVVTEQEKYIDQYYEVDQNGQAKVKIFLGQEQIAELNQEGLDYFLYDNLGSVSAVLSSSGTVKELNDYKPYGSLQCRAGHSLNERQFIGKEKDLETAWQYFGQRYYDQLLGRFTSIDPLLLTDLSKVLANPQYLNSYSYAGNNPMSFIDFLGLSTATVNPMPENGWQFGNEMGQFNGVKAYYNGIGSLDIRRSCVEYAKRYLSETKGLELGTVYDPNYMWNNTDKVNAGISKSPYTLLKYKNGQGFVLPREGDLLIWTDKHNGHVMIVTESSFDTNKNHGYVEIIDQNANVQAVRKFDVVRTDNGYSVMKNKNEAMAGWLSPVNKNDVAANKSTNTAVFLQKAWQSVQRIFNKFWGK